MPCRPLLASLALAALSAAGCAHEERKMTFGEAGLVDPIEPDGPARPPAVVPAPRKVASEVPTGPPIDATLLRFAAEARSRRQRASAGAGFPAEAIYAWNDLSSELDRYLARPLPQTPLLELVRARVTVEAELEYDRRRYGEAPDALCRAVAERLGRFGVRVEAARALGKAMFARPAPAALRWPVERAGISSPFGMRVHPLDGQRKMHFGVDLAASRGVLVTAAAKGYVVQAGWASGYGLMVEVRHEGDLTTRYSHLSGLLCAPGDAVDPGQPLGLVGATGKATGPHLHFEVWRGGRARDPLVLLGAQVAGGAGD